MSETVAVFVNNLKRLEKEYETLPRKIVNARALAVTTSVRGQIGRTTHGGRLRGVGKKGAKVGARYDIKGTVNPTAIVQATGPLHLLERDTRAHDIPRTQSSRRTRTSSGRLSNRRVGTGRNLSGRKLLVINGHVRTGPVRVRGSKGKHPFAKGVLLALPFLGETSHRQVTAALAKVYRH